jgi:catechol 2,3-dioxygenase-like lactoylglutathione lyase family enzyme
LTDVNTITILIASTNVNVSEAPMSRVQLALNVSDLEAAIEFYAELFSSPPAKVRPGYANFAIADPPLKLVLIETPDHRGTGLAGALNHLGIEVETPEDVVRADSRLAAGGLSTTAEHETTCCYAVQDKVWVKYPDGAPWELYTVLADAPVWAGSCGDSEGICCQLQSEVRSEVAAVASNCC